MNLKASAVETVYVREVLNCFRVVMPEATQEQRRNLASKTLFRMRLWEIIYQFRVRNYGIRDVLDSEFIDA